MGIAAAVIAGVLLVTGLASLTVFVERLLALRRSRSASQGFSRQVASDMNAGTFDAVITAADGFTPSHLARVVRPGLAAISSM